MSLSNTISLIAFLGLSTAAVVVMGVAVGYDHYSRQEKDFEADIRSFQTKMSDLSADHLKELNDKNYLIDKLNNQIEQKREYAASLEDELDAILRPTNPEPMTATVVLFARDEGTGATTKGSGTHIGNGLILTAEHVVGSEGSRISTRFENGDETFSTVLWSSVDYDVALMRMDDFSDAPASHIECRTLNLEEELTFYGNPGPLEFVVTHGRVMDNVIDVFKHISWQEVVPVDAMIAHGMSGGGTFDSDHDLVGINIGIMPHYSSTGDVTNTGIGFIVPSSTFCPLLGR